eukprot:TRINITY_DN3277_c0_g1_i2.p1 TRINITY_DN3277_c0_g1~~TRINITY_DN3277_c0_g1_i2.p1  ORF type:complete len:183 (-),score=49.13 TRINITY_DN3277_c0_g1_i2:186-734(-)
MPRKIIKKPKIVETKSERRCFACYCSSKVWRRGPEGKGTLCNACGVEWFRCEKSGKELHFIEKTENLREKREREAREEGTWEEVVNCIEAFKRKRRMKENPNLSILDLNASIYASSGTPSNEFDIIGTPDLFMECVNHQDSCPSSPLSSFDYGSDLELEEIKSTFDSSTLDLSLFEKVASSY